MWKVTKCTDDGMTTYNVTWENSIEAVLECRLMGDATKVAELLNKLEVGPDSNHVKVQPWQLEMLEARQGGLNKNHRNVTVEGPARSRH